MYDPDEGRKPDVQLSQRMLSERDNFKHRMREKMDEVEIEFQKAEKERAVLKERIWEELVDEIKCLRAAIKEKD